MSRLSKSQFIRGLQCHKSLWLYRNRYELRTEPDDFQQAIFNTGTNVGILAQQLFAGGHEIVYAPDKIDENVKKTKELIESGTETIYEASFIYDNVLVLVDILHKGTDGWEIYEVKSSTGVIKKNQLKTQYKHDVSVQYYVLKGNGMDISKVCMIHLNNKYVFRDELDIKQLFTIENVTDAVIEHQSFVKDQLSLQWDMLDSDEPQIDIGLYCSNPYLCDFKEYCWQHIPKYSVFSISGLYKTKMFELYNQGIIKFEDIPEDNPLNKNQQLQVDTELYGTEVINKTGIEEFLSQLNEPIGFLDFETFMPAVPSFNKQRPYQVIPFQYSLHILENDNLKHYEYLGEPGEDPRIELIDKMIAETKKCKTILAYNKTYEIERIKELAKDFPDRAEELNGIIDRIIDLMKPFKNKDYYTKEMKGGYSIKVVLPALIPELSYDDLDIGGGGMAMDAYAKLQSMTDTKEIEKIKNDLLKYCGLDTFAMVKILEKLQSVV